MMHLINYKVTLQYEGTRYRGWQKQPGVENTIQGKLEALLARLMDTPVEVYGAGRTDAGVHALGQVASFRVPEEGLRALAGKELCIPGWPGTDQKTGMRQYSGMERKTGEKQQSETDLKSGTENSAKMNCEAERRSDEVVLPSIQKRIEDAALFAALNHYLPEDIAVVRLVRSSDRFHARYLTASKWYQYRIRTSCVSDVRNRRFLWQYGESLDLNRMREGAKALVGRHDFASFCGLKMKKSTVRTVSRIDITRPDEDTIVLDFYGDGFLNHMVRLMTGELVEAGAGRLESEAIERILSECRKGAAVHTAPASGLTLMEVRY